MNKKPQDLVLYRRPSSCGPGRLSGQRSVLNHVHKLAWHIVRRPRGLVAAAIQYGHVHVQITLGYSGTYASGFPDDHAFEEWLLRLEQIAEGEQRLADGGRVSGPAADAYRHRVHAANAKFGGRVLSTDAARDTLANPLLQIYPGRAMTCVFESSKALCELRSDEKDLRRTPDQDDCRPNCQNIAYTDQNIGELKAEARELRTARDEFLAPSPRHRREIARLRRVEDLISTHETERLS